MNAKKVKDMKFGVALDQVYKSTDPRSNGRQVAVKAVVWQDKAHGRFHAQTFYAKCETPGGFRTTIACSMLASYRWRIIVKPATIPAPAVDSRNIGHGHVNKRPDGHLARCGGPGICAHCSTEKAGVLA